MSDTTWPFYGYAPGNYMCRCLTCQSTFQGDKLAYECLECAMKKSRALATQHHQGGPVECVACEGKPAGENVPCAVCGRSALAHQPLSVQEGWRPMDTAPTDGTRILAVHENGSDIQITWFGKTSHVPLYGWCEGEDAEDIDLWRPTHWQPLPAAPTVGGKE